MTYQRRIAVAILVLSGMLVCQDAPASPQTSTASTPSKVSSGSGSTLLISIRAKDGSVEELATRDIEIKENGKLVPVQQVRKLNRVPLRYCVLFDTSNSERFKFKFQQDVAAELLRQVVRPGTDRGWLALFDLESRQSNETADPTPIANAIAASKPAGPTALYDAVTVCASRMETSRSEPEFRVMFLFSDGNDNQSHRNSDEAAEAALKAGTRIYAIDPNQEGARGPAILKKLAESTGGRVFFPESMKEVGGMAAELSGDLQSLFAITYASGTSKADSHSQRIEVECVKKGVTVLAPKRTYSSHP